jgi:hypothetical protein
MSLPMTAAADRRLPVYRVISEPYLLFHPIRAADRHVHPLLGLLQFGPYGSAVPTAMPNPIRVAVIAPKGELEKVGALISELSQEQVPRERPAYLPAYPGMQKVFGLRAVVASRECVTELPEQLDEHVKNAPRPHDEVAERVVRCLRDLTALRSEFDVIMVYLPERWERAFYGGEGEDFDLHDHIKAAAASFGLASQILNDDAFHYRCRASVAWRLSIALYAKAGGIPWKLADAPLGTAFIGLSYALRLSSAHDQRFVTCCSQVFDHEGAGLEFIAYDTTPLRMQGKNPFLSRDEMRRVMARSLSLYAHEHVGKSPERVVVHKSTRFTPDEVDGCLDGFAGVPDVELVQVQVDSPWLGIRATKPTPDQKGVTADSYPVERGTLIPFGSTQALLWTSGNAPSAVGGRNFYKEGKSVPSPLLLSRFAGSWGWDEVARSVLALSKMNWNNDSLYDRLPTTMGYARVLADTLKHVHQVTDIPYPFRLFM